MLSLEACLFNPTAQICLAKIFKSAIERCECTPLEKIDLLFGQISKDELCSKKRKKDGRKTTIASIYAVDGPSVVDDPDSHRQSSIHTIKQYLAWIINHGSLDMFQLTWCAITIMYVSDEIKAVISKNTHPIIATEFFSNFNIRFEVHLCGQLKHIKSEKRSTLVRQAKTPFEIIAAEWLNFKKLYMKVF